MATTCTTLLNEVETQFAKENVGRLYELHADAMGAVCTICMD